MDYVKYIREKVGNDKIILNSSVCLILKDGKLLLQKRSDNGEWGLIGGILELNETYSEGAIREAKEETGLDVKLNGFLGIFHNHNMIWPNGDEAHTIDAYFVGEIVGGKIKLDKESLELKFFDLDELPRLFSKTNYLGIEAYKKGKIFKIFDENSYDK